MSKYTVIIEKGPTSWGSYVPDLPGCVAVAATEDKVRKLIKEAIEFHIDGLLEDGEPVPKPTSVAREIEVQCRAQVVI